MANGNISELANSRSQGSGPGFQFPEGGEGTGRDQTQSATPRGEEEQSSSDGADLLKLLAGLGGGILLAELVMSAAESGVKGDVANAIADALEEGISS